MKNLEFDGSWWLPDRVDRKVPGTVVFDDDGLRLVLYGDFEAGGPPKIGPTTGKWLPREYSIVHGVRHKDRKPMTLFGVSGHILELPFETYSQYNFTVGVALVNSRLGSGNFKRASFEYDYLTVWTQPPGRRILDPDDQDLLRLQTGSMELARTTLEDGSTLTLRSGLEGSEGDSSVELHEYCAFDVASSEPHAWDYFADLARKGRDLLILSLGRPVRIRWIILGGIEDARSCEAYYPLDEPLADEVLSAAAMQNNIFDYRAPTLLTAKGAAGNELPISLEKLLSRWFSSYDRLAETLHLMMGFCTASTMLSEHRFSSLFSSAEELYKCLALSTREESKPDLKVKRARVIKELEKEGLELSVEDRAWLIRLVTNSRNDKSIPQRVFELLGLAGAVGERILAEAPGFGTNAARARGKVSHGPGGAAPYRLVRLCYELTLRWALRVVIISELFDETDRAAFQTAAASKAAFVRIAERLGPAEAAVADAEKQPNPAGPSDTRAESVPKRAESNEPGVSTE